jgi:Transposase and inactivated derivatives
MAKYSTEFKRKIVAEYLKGMLSYRSLAKKYNIPGIRQIEAWVAAFQRLGTAGISRSRQKKSYSFQFKLHAVELYLSTEISYQDLALQLEINNPTLLTQWVQRFRAVGVDGLKPNRKGRRPKVPDKPIVATPTQSKEIQDERFKQLEEENLKLRIEVAYLKELRRLRLEQEAQKREQGSSTVSEDHSN